VYGDTQTLVRFSRYWIRIALGLVSAIRQTGDVGLGGYADGSPYSPPWGHDVDCSIGVGGRVGRATRESHSTGASVRPMFSCSLSSAEARWFRSARWKQGGMMSMASDEGSVYTEIVRGRRGLHMSRITQLRVGSQEQLRADVTVMYSKAIYGFCSAHVCVRGTDCRFRDAQKRR
jgi:hypothetical protein